MLKNEFIQQHGVCEKQISRQTFIKKINILQWSLKHYLEF